MPTNAPIISDNIIKQIFLLAIIILLGGLIFWYLRTFVPSLLGAITFYILLRRYNFYLQDVRKWKPWLSAIVLMLASLIILVLPVYFIIDILVEKLGNAQQYLGKFNEFMDKIQNFVNSKFHVDIMSKENTNKVKDFAGKFSTTAITGTFNTLTVITSMYFILYFMLEKPALFERLLVQAAPLKRANINLIGEKIRKMVVANAVGIPVVSIGQGIVALIGYYIFGAPSPLLLFALTSVASMIPIVGAGTIFVPVGIFMVANGDNNGFWLMLYCFAIVGVVDNVLRFTVLKKLENIHPLNTIFGIIMGINLFGFIGLIFGPILVSITVLLIQVYKDEFSDDDRELILPDKEELEKKVEIIL